MRSLFVLLALAVAGCGGGAAPAPVAAAAKPTCSVPVKFGNQSRFSTSALESRAVTSAHDVLDGERACGRAFTLSFALDATEDEPTAVRTSLNLSVEEKGAIVATSSVTLRIPKPVTDDDAAAAIAKASAVLTRQAVAKVR